MLTLCIELDRECAEAGYVGARLMRIDGERQLCFARLVPKYVMPVRKIVRNTLNMEWRTVADALKHVELVQKNAGRCQREYICGSVQRS